LASNDTSSPTIIDNFNCFNIQLPVEVTANGQELLIATEADYELIEAIFNQSNDDEDTLEFRYPINVITADYQVVPVANEAALDAMADDCAGQGVQDILDCISLNYPVTLMGYDDGMALQDTYIIDSDAELSSIIDGLGENENYALQYPISLTGFNGQQITISSNNTLLTALQAAVAECQANSCDTDFTAFQQAYGAISVMTNAAEEFTMDAWTHEYTFSMAQAGTICSIGYKAEFQPTPIVYLVEILDASGNAVYTGNHSFSTTMMEYISIPTVSINANEQYTIKRSISSYAVGSGIGTIIWSNQNTTPQPALLPYTLGDITVHHSRYYGGGGGLDPDYHSIPEIDFVFKPL
jgi:hypothetical protein